MSILETYERLLKEATVAEGLSGGLDISRAHEASDESILRIWQRVMLQIFAADTAEYGERFSALSPDQQRAYFNPDSIFCFERFRDSFVKRFREHHAVVLN